jgi:hypothetical protein
MVDCTVREVICNGSINGRADAPGKDEGCGVLGVLEVKQGTIFHPSLGMYEH